MQRWLIARAAARSALDIGQRQAAQRRPGVEVYRADSSDPASFKAMVAGMKGRS